jgi:DNA-binding GntR family transcriptional regulator
MTGNNLDVRGPLPLRPNSLREQIRESIRRQLQHGEIGPEERLVDVEIANRLGVSRMPVREALLQLVNEGYLIGTTRGFVLPTLSLKDIKDIFEVRKLLEPRAAANAARHLTPASKAALRDALARARKAHAARDFDELAAASRLFRSTWLAAEPNWRMAATIQRFVDQVQIVRLGTLHDPETQDIVIDGLEKLVDAFGRRDAEAVEALMMAFILSAESHFFAAHARRQAAGETDDRQVAT